MSPSMPDGLSLIGKTVDGKYHIESLLGKGGFGAVYRATHVMMAAPCALKVLHSQLISDALAVTRFQREAQAAARIHHPNAIAVTDFGISPDGIVYLVMEYFDGMTVRELIQRRGPASLERTAHIIERAAAALQAAHKQGIIHRDIKPDNIMVRTNDEGEEEVKVLDFGIAKLLDSPTGGERLTMTGTVVGTPQYLSPEQCKGNELDARSDIYALGIVAYEMLSGAVPFDGATPFTVALKHISEPAAPLASLVSGLAPEIDVVVQRAIAKEPAHRYQSISEFAHELTATAKMAAARAGTGGSDVGTIMVGVPQQSFKGTIRNLPPDTPPVGPRQTEPWIEGWTPVAGPAVQTPQTSSDLPTMAQPVAPPNYHVAGAAGHDAVPTAHVLAATEPAAKPSKAPMLVVVAIAGLFFIGAIVALAAYLVLNSNRGDVVPTAGPTSAPAPAPAPGPVADPAPAPAPAVPILDCWVGLSAAGDQERRVDDLGGVVAVAPGEQRIRFHFTPRKKGYLYVVGTLENGTWAQLTSNPGRQKLQTNAVDVGRDLELPGTNDTYIPYVGPVTFTIIYSPTPLAAPAFLSGQSGRQLTDDEVAEWERFRTSPSLGRLEDATDQGALTTLRGPDSSSEPKPLAYTITLERR